ncbi:MAG: hypothetical protein ACPG8W_00205 [Candidatus Promineifilaceae bacterium]
MLLLIIPTLLLFFSIGTFTTIRMRRQKQTGEKIIPPRLSKRSDKKRRKLPQLLVAWFEERDKHGVGAWLRKLPAKELALLTKDVTAYAHDMGFDLLWVVDKQIDDVALREQISNAVYQYVYSFYAAVVSRDEMQFYMSLTDFLNNLNSRKHRAQMQAVFKHLTDDGVIPYSAELIFQPKHKRRYQIEQLILKASQTNREALKQALRATSVTQQ